MTELSENQKQRKYFKAVFGDKNPKNNKKKIEAALHRAHKIRQFEICLYWQKNWGMHIDYLEDDITGKLHKTIMG